MIYTGVLVIMWLECEQVKHTKLWDLWDL